MKKIALFFCSFVLFQSAFSQTVGITDFMRLNPYSNFNNPAAFVPYNWYVGVPGVSNLNFAYYNSGFSINKLSQMSNNSGNLPVDLFVKKSIKDLSKTSWLNMNVGAELLGCGFRVPKLDNYFFTFSYQIKMEQQLSYSKDLLGLLMQYSLGGNVEEFFYTRETPATLRLSQNTSIYQEFSLGMQSEVLDNLYVGARTKFLFGMLNMKTNSFSAEVFPDLNDQSIIGKFNIDLDVASVIPFYVKNNNEILLTSDGLNNFGGNFGRSYGKSFSKNAGFAIDLGAVYRINKQFRVSAAITDLGFIRWRSTPLNMTIKSVGDGIIDLKGFSKELMADIVKNGFNLSLDSLLTLANINFTMRERSAYTTMLTSKIMTDCYFDLNSYTRFILQFKGYIIGKTFLPQFTIAYNGTFFDAIDVVVSYSMMKKSFANLGVGLGFRMGPAHLYLGTDNIIVAAHLLNTAKVNFTAGLLVDFPFKIKHKEAELKSMFKKDKKRTLQIDES